MKGNYFSTTFGNMYYRTKEGDAATHLVCIHGAGGDSRLFIPLMNEIKKITVHAIDLPAHGKSKIYECSLNVYVHAMAQFIQSLQGNVFVLGHSMGGGIIFELSRLKVPFTGAVFLATAGTLTVNPVVFELLEKDFDSFCKLAVDLSYGSIDETMKATAIEYMRQAGSDILKNDFSICNNYNYEEDAKSFTTGACFITSRKDKMVPLDVTYATFKRMPNAMLQVFPYKGHMLHIERPRQVAFCIEQFVELSL
ncbi:MAG: alpha/beta hydrolase [Spirochaetes bacterium]|nr:alpha/beta hydrolase [Spirochaetota bacterium]